MFVKRSDLVDRAIRQTGQSSIVKNQGVPVLRPKYRHREFNVIVGVRQHLHVHLVRAAGTSGTFVSLEHSTLNLWSMRDANILALTSPPTQSTVATTYNGTRLGFHYTTDKPSYHGNKGPQKQTKRDNQQMGRTPDLKRAAGVSIAHGRAESDKKTEQHQGE